MAAEDSEPRATVALVAEKVESLKQLTNLGFSTIQHQLDNLSDLPVKVTRLEGERRDLDRRIAKLEREEESSVEWKRGPLVLAAIAGISALLNLLIAGGAIHV